VGLVLTDTRSAADTSEARAKRLATVERLGHPAEGLDIPGTVRGLLAPSTISGQPSVVSVVERMVSAPTPRALVPTLLAIAHRPDLTPVLARIEVPTLVIWGEEDRLIPPAESQSMTTRIHGALGVAIPNAGHLPSLETPEPFTNALQKYLRGLRLAWQ
jgi:pimeloyl-ACP methyl ester carboxylesterase